jgi:hypothetical protein
MTSEVQEGPLEQALEVHAPAAPQTKTWREQRWERRRRRIWFEEILGWILVPVIVLGVYWFIDMVLTALGTSPGAIIEGIKAILAAL